MKKIIFFILISIILLIPITAYSLPTNSDLSDVSTKIETLVAVGDLSFSGIDGIILKDPEYPWAGTKEILQTATILMGNQEIPLSNRGSIYTKKKWILRAHPGTVKSLAAAGFDVVTLANNHILDYGPVAMKDTLDTLDSASIAHVGAGMNLDEARKFTIITSPEGVRFAFLAYSLVYPAVFWANKSRPGTPYGGPENFIPDIKKAKTMADHVIVSFHWSDERQFYPKDYQKIYGKKCIDAGASIVIGHHPHVLQGFEVYKNGLIAYSLGNFVFGSRHAHLKDSVILALEYDRDGFIQAKIYPVNVNNLEVEYRPQFRRGTDAERVLNDLRTYSKEFGTKIESQGEIGVINLRK